MACSFGYLELADDFFLSFLGVLTMCDSLSVQLVSSLVSEARSSMLEAIAVLEAGGEESVAIAFFSPVHAGLLDLEAACQRSSSILRVREIRNDSSTVRAGCVA